MTPHHTIILSSHLRLVCPSGLFPSGFQNKTLRELLYSIRAIWSTYLIIFYFLFITIMFTEEFGSLSSSLCSFLYFPVTSSLLGPKFYSAPHSQTPLSYTPLWKWQTKFHTDTKQQTGFISVYLIFIFVDTNFKTQNHTPNDNLHLPLLYCM